MTFKEPLAALSGGYEDIRDVLVGDVGADGDR
jgi:hypothetical protein